MHLHFMHNKNHGMHHVHIYADGHFRLRKPDTERNAEKPRKWHPDYPRTHVDMIKTKNHNEAIHNRPQ